MTYEELREKRGNKYRTMYIQALNEKNTEKAWKILKTMMRYQLISKEEALPEIKSKFKDKKLDMADVYDYRHPNFTDRVPDNLMFRCPTTVEVQVKSLEHWIIRRELQFVGDQLAPDKVLRFDVSRCVTTRMAHKYLKDTEELFRNLSGMELKTSWKNGIDNGNVIVYNISLGNNQQYIIRHLGTVVCVPTGKCLNMYILLDNKAMIEQNIDIIDTYTDVLEALKNQFIELGADPETITPVGICDFKIIGQKQRAERKPVLTTEEMHRKREKEFEQEQLENEAARLHMSTEDVLAMRKRLAEAEKVQNEPAKIS